MQEKLRGAAARSFAAMAWITVAPAAVAMSLGDIEVRSALGEVLDARVPLGLGAGEVVDATCFALARDPEPGVPVLAEGLLTVERLGDRAELRIRSSNAVFEPAMRVRIRASCPGQSGEALRQYSVLLDPRRGDPVVANVPVVSARLDARTGDTLAGIATKVFPRNRAARDRYLQAMREVNPALASLADTDPIPMGANVALPDLRTFGRDSGRNVTVARAPRTESAAPVASEKSARRKARGERTKTARGKPPVVAAPTAPAPTAPVAGDVVLRLSGGSMDVSRTRETDDRTRAQLRERLMILESDDQVAAVLALRNRLTQLEQRVNELQLKLAQMPASFPAPREATPPAAPAPAAEPAKPAAVAAAPDIARQAPKDSTAPKDATPAAEPSKDSTAAAEVAKPQAPAAETSATAATTAATPAPQAAPAPATKPEMRGAKPAPAFDLTSLGHSYGLWAAFIAVLALLMALVWRLTHRPEPAYEAEEWDQPPPTTQPGPFAADEGVIDSTATQVLEAPDAGALRQRYIEERFPEVVNGTIALDDPASVIKGARLLYEDGATPRATELLQFSIEEHPEQVRTWLALFEIYRLERLTTEFADLARRFYEQFGNTEYWRKVRYFGREIDPGNFLYREDVDALETIGPGSSRKEPAERVDAARENWLDAPTRFDNEVLANELRRALMSGAGVVDEDLVPNPMPALRDAEMFTVA